MDDEKMIVVLPRGRRTTKQKRYLTVDEDTNLKINRLTEGLSKKRQSDLIESLLSIVVDKALFCKEHGTLEVSLEALPGERII